MEIERGWRVHGTLFCSALLRAWQTASLAGARLGERLGRTFEIQATDALFERSVGSAANLSIEEIESAVAADPRLEDLRPGWKARPEERLPFPGAESLVESGRRVASFLLGVTSDLRRSLSEDTLVVVVGHGASLRHAGVPLGLFTDSVEAGAVSMHHARPVVCAVPESGAWLRVAGDWKPRAAERGED